MFLLVMDRRTTILKLLDVLGCPVMYSAVL